MRVEEVVKPLTCRRDRMQLVEKCGSKEMTVSVVKTVGRQAMEGDLLHK